MYKPIFREYIGVKPSLRVLRDFPNQIINSKISEFHFILGFAIDTYDKNKRGTGIFKENWNVEFFGPEEVRKLKEKYANVKVVISIGGCDVNKPFNPANESLWVKEAIQSLKVIIKKYKGENGNLIDGIDINYENITHSTADRVNRRFGNCIGQVITTLRNDPNLRIQVVSIAPSENNEPHYLNLYWGNKGIINFVNYQFYKESDVDLTPSDFIKLYNKVAEDYDAAKIIPGITTIEHEIPGPEEEVSPWYKMAKENFIDGCTQLLKDKSLHGIFLWNADDSAIPPSAENKAFLLEHFLQSLLVGN